MSHCLFSQMNNHYLTEPTGSPPWLHMRIRVCPSMKCLKISFLGRHFQRFYSIAVGYWFSSRGDSNIQAGLRTFLTEHPTSVITGYLCSHFWGKHFPWSLLPTPTPCLQWTRQLQRLCPHSICTCPFRRDLWGYLQTWSTQIVSSPVQCVSMFPLPCQPWVLATVQVWHIRISHHLKFVFHSHWGSYLVSQ